MQPPLPKSGQTRIQQEGERKLDGREVRVNGLRPRRGVRESRGRKPALEDGDVGRGLASTVFENDTDEEGWYRQAGTRGVYGQGRLTRESVESGDFWRVHVYWGAKGGAAS